MQLPVMIHVQTLQHGIYSNADFPCQTTRYQNCFLTNGTDDNIVIPLHDHFFVCVCVCVCGHTRTTDFTMHRRPCYFKSPIGDLERRLEQSELC